MPSPKILLALAAIGASVVSAQDDDCKSVTIKSAGDANIDCKTVKGDITFDEDSDITGDVNISGPEEVEGNIVVKKAAISSLSSSSIEKIGGKFQLQELKQLSTIDFTALEEVNEIEWIALTALEGVNFGTDGVTTSDKIRISDTSLSSLEGLNMASVGTFSIDNNQLLTLWETRLTNITKSLIVADNSADLEVSFPRLENAADIDVRGVKELAMPLLEEITGSFLLTDNNVMESFIAPNLTETGATVSLRNNDGLSNVTFPVLTKTGGSLTLHNNQKLVEIDGFPELETVEGSVTMRGNFTDIELPALEKVDGTFDVQSTEDIEDACSTLEDVKNVGGKFNCESENENANEGSDKDPSEDDEDAGVFLGANGPLVLSVAVIGGLLQLL